MAFLDFETVGLAIPAWPGCSPYDNVPVQFSVHVERGGGLDHHEWLARDPVTLDARSRGRLLDACAGVETVGGLQRRIRARGHPGPGACVPRPRTAAHRPREPPLDLLPVVREHVYHPTFGGSFSLKSVLPALANQGYGDLAVADGGTASASLVRLLFDTLADEERDVLRRDLLAYCARDTWALVLLLRRLRELAAVGVVECEPFLRTGGASSEVHDGDARPACPAFLERAHPSRPSPAEYPLDSTADRARRHRKPGDS